MRAVKVGTETYLLENEAPKIESYLERKFFIPEAIGNSAVADVNMKKGLIIVSTLPNIQKEHCIQQVVELQTITYKLLPSSTKIFHFSSDTRLDWKAAEKHLAGLHIKAYTLYDAVHRSVVEFKAAFGVGVQGTPRIAHGLFALINGKFVNIQIPDDQLGIPNVPLFLKNVLDVRVT
jgi:hypothetical protein